MRITTATVRTNVEVAPFQHIRIELTATFDDNDADLDACREQLADETLLFIAKVKKHTAILRQHDNEPF